MELFWGVPFDEPFRGLGRAGTRGHKVEDASGRLQKQDLPSEKRTKILDAPINWVAVKELNLSYSMGKTLSNTVYTHYGNLIEVP